MFTCFLFVTLFIQISSTGKHIYTWLSTIGTPDFSLQGTYPGNFLTSEVQRCEM
jgi:hypothetical protein